MQVRRVASGGRKMRESCFRKAAKGKPNLIQQAATAAHALKPQQSRNRPCLPPLW